MRRHHAPGPRPIRRRTTALLLLVALLGAALSVVAPGPVTAGAQPPPHRDVAVEGSVEDPSNDPADDPSDDPAEEPSGDPSGEPTDQPSGQPSEEPSEDPSGTPGEEEPSPGEWSGDSSEESPASPEQGPGGLTPQDEARGAEIGALDAVTPWSCNGEGILFQDGDPALVYRIDLVTGQPRAPISIPGRQINAVGYNPVDNFVYGWDLLNGTIVRVDSLGGIDELGPTTGIPAELQERGTAVGDVDDQGYYWVNPGSRFYQIDLRTNSVVDEGQVPRPAAAESGVDWVFLPGSNKFWAVVTDEARTQSYLISFDRTTHTWSPMQPLGNLGGATSENVSGGIYADSDGFLYVSYNRTGQIIRVDPRTLATKFMANGPVSGGNDGARCARAPVNIDLGDAPEGYGTTLDDNGPRHGVDGYDPDNFRAPLTLGRRVDPEPDGVPSPRATSDDQTAGPAIDDEDALDTPPQAVPGGPLRMSVTAFNRTGDPATLAGWLDIDDDGTFEASERRTATVPADSTPATPTLDFGTAPSPGERKLRLRLFPGTVADPSPVGSAASGEVEDHNVTITAPATQPWSCTPDGVLFQSADASALTDDWRVNLGSGVTSSDAQIPGFRINAIGYNVQDNFVYGWDNVSRQLVRVGADGGVSPLGIPADPSGLLTADNAPAVIVGDVDDNGDYWAEIDTLDPPSPGAPTPPRWFRIDLDAPGGPTVVASGVSNRPGGGADWAFLPGTDRLWTVGSDGAGRSILTALDRSTGTWSAPVDLGPIGGEGSGQQVGAVFADSMGFLYASYNQTGQIWRVNPATAEAFYFSTGAPSNNNDGARCAAASTPIDFGDAPVNGTTLATDGARHALVGFDGSTAPLMLGTTVDLDADGVPGPAASGDDTTGADDEDAVTGPLQHVAGQPVSVPVTATNSSGQPASLVGWLDLDGDGAFTAAERVVMPVGASTGTASYTLTFPAVTTGGDTYLRLRLFPGSPADPQPVGGAAAGEVEDHLVAVPRVPVPTLDKSADRVALPDGGETVSYSVVATNVGNGDYTAAAPLVVVDDLTDVLDDATLAPGSVQADRPGGTLEVSANRITWSGPLPAGQSVRITYQVTYAASGDLALTNVAFVTGCVPGTAGCPPPPTPACVGNVDPATGLPCDVVDIPGARVTAAKDSVPADGSTVVAGQDVTYTLTFDNDGPATGNVNWTDHVGHVLDDADVVVAPSSTTPGLVVGGIEGGAFRITGTLPPNSQGTVTYTVRVRPDGQRGDHRLVNLLLRGAPPATPPAAVCAAGDPLCTEHRVPQIVDSKAASPGSGTVVAAGAQLTYQLTFSNQGAAAGDVLKEDDMSGVLDDAVLITPPFASDAALTVSAISAGRFTVSGTLQPGQTVTVTYVVQVKPDEQRATEGDDKLNNALVLPGTTAQCPPQTPDVTCHFIPRLVDSKSVSVGDGAVVQPNQEVTYTLTFANEGTAPGAVSREDTIGGVLDDATLLSAPTASDPALNLSAIAAGRFTITGTLQPDQTVTVTYTVRVKPDAQREAEGSDNQLGNAVVEPGDPFPSCADQPDPDVTCNKIPLLTDSKSANPASGSVVKQNEEVTYTLTFANIGEAPGNVAREDDLGGVLDDAVIVSGPTVSDPALAVGPPTGRRLSITGTLQPDQSVTVSYTVRVLPDDERVANGGDDQLGNAIVEPGGTALCPATTPDQTCHGIPRLVDSKSATPTSGSVVEQGGEVTYELTFSNPGKGAGDVAREDDLSDVLDDAEMVTPPVSSDPALTVSAVLDGRFSVSGTLEPGLTVTVSYTVRVLPDDERVANGGNDLLGNFIVDPGGEGGDCRTEPTPDCAITLIPRLVDRKAVQPASGSAVRAGRVLRYTLTFTNEGTGAGTMTRFDDLTHLLDDAVLLTRPTPSSSALVVTRESPTTFRIAGELDPLETVTVTYTARVRPDGRRGDDIVANFLLPDGSTVPDEPRCATDDPDCTINLVSEIVATKDVRPRSGTEVRPGQELTYRLRFENTGKGEGALRYDDDLSGVLDDARLVGEPSVSGEGVTVSRRSGTIRVRGMLAPGSVAVVEYVVRVDRAVRGDRQLLNFLLAEGEEPSASCPTGSDRCTLNPVAGEVGGDAEIPDTGGPSLVLLLLGGGLVALGGGVLVRRRRPSRSGAS